METITRRSTSYDDNEDYSKLGNKNLLEKFYSDSATRGGGGGVGGPRKKEFARLIDLITSYFLPRWE